MGQIKATQRLVVEDFPDQKGWIAKLLSPVNRFITEVVAAINGGIEFGSNIMGVEKELDFVYHANALPVSFKWPLSKRPRDFRVLQVTEDGEPIIGLVSWAFTADGMVSVTRLAIITTVPDVADPTSGNRYKILVRVTP